MSFPRLRTALLLLLLLLALAVGAACWRFRGCWPMPG